MDFVVKVKLLITGCNSVGELVRELGLSDNGNNFKKIKAIIEEHNIDTSHFVKVGNRKGTSQYKTIKKICKCDTIFETVNGGKNEKMFCSRTCANSRAWSDDDKKKKSESAKSSEKVKEANKNKIKPNSRVKRSNIRISKVPKLKKIRETKEYTSTCNICTTDFCSTKRYSIVKFCSESCRKEGQSKIQKALYASGKNYVAGGTTKWLPYKDIKVQGTYELRTCAILDKLLSKNEIASWEYTSDKIPYIGIDGKEHTYLLDFKVTRPDGTFYYIETKGYKRENDEFKWEATRDSGYELVVWYLEDIEKTENNL